MSASFREAGSALRRAKARALIGFLSAAAALAGCASVEPEATVSAPPIAQQPPKPVDPAAREAVASAYRAACVSTPLNLDGAAAALEARGFREALLVDQPEDGVFRRFLKGDVTAELRLGKRRPAVVSNCLVTSPSLDRDAAREVVLGAVAASGLPYEARDLAALGDPDAHDVLGTAVGSDFWGVVMIVETGEAAGAGMLKTPKRN